MDEKERQVMVEETADLPPQDKQTPAVSRNHAWCSVKTNLPPQHKRALQRRAQDLGMSLSAFIRDLLTNSKQTTEEILTREWVSIALQLRNLQSDREENAELRRILEQLEQLIRHTTLRKESDQGI